MSAPRELQRLVEGVGLEVVHCEQARGGGHWRLRARRADGAEANFIFPYSTSDRRAADNQRALLRRFQAGWSPVMPRGETVCPN